MTAWGWLHVLYGSIVVAAGFGIYSGATWARIVGITLASVSAIGNFFFIAYQPVWALLIIALDVPRDRGSLGACADESSDRRIPVAGRLLYVGHATVLIELDGVRLLTDPVLRSRVWHLRRRVPLDTAELAGIDAALVSHGHFDHLDRPSLRLLGTDVTVVVPSGGRRLVRGFADVREVDVGDEMRVGEVTIKATPAVHRSVRLMRRSGPSLGFLISGSRRVYFAGDTDLFEGMSALAGSLDVALLPVAGWGSKVGPGHLDPLRAAQSLSLLKPRLAVPIHWGTFSPLIRSTSADPPEAFRRHAAELAPEVEVRILDPGTARAF